MNTLLEPQGAANLVTMKLAAEEMGIHFASMRRLVAKGLIPRRGRVGRTVLVSRDDVAAYFRLGRPSLPPNRLEAIAHVKTKSGVIRPYRIRSFSWDQVPLLRKRLADKFGSVPFELAVQSSDGTRFRLRCDPPKNW